MRFRLEQVEIPVLDGKLTMQGFATDPPGDEDWRWSFSGAVDPDLDGALHAGRGVAGHARRHRGARFRG